MENLGWHGALGPNPGMPGPAEAVQGQAEAVWAHSGTRGLIQPTDQLCTTHLAKA